ncbi:MAG: peptidase T [Bacilli bacterium]|jgi:tripeptide aminopeptidase|nr:peptidase T [Bacilli bacterium]
MTIKGRFIHYTTFDTQSDDHSTSSPSTDKQWALLKALKEELIALGVKDVELSSHGVLYAHIPSNSTKEIVPTIGFIAHVDTALEMSGKDVKARVINNYDGKAITLNQAQNIIMDPEHFPALKRVVGDDLVVTDGTTLLGADDKAGVAIIMTLVESLVHQDAPIHGPIAIAFTPDEEIGRGVENFDLARMGADYAYTIDGSDIEFANYENFNAASAVVTIAGKSIHPGDAKDKMVNSILVAMEFNALLPPEDVPAKTDGYQGFNHVTAIEGGVNKTMVEYIIRNHDMEKLEKQIRDFQNAAAKLNEKYGQGTVDLMVKKGYRNMGPLLKKDPAALHHLEAAYHALGLPLSYVPIRGGTDGAELSYRGMLTPNLGTGGFNMHGRYEFASLNQMQKMVDILTQMVKIG